MLENTRVGYARQMARNVLKKYSINVPPVDIKQILTGYGYEYLELDTFPDNLDALFINIDGISYAAVNKKHHPNRKNFSVAHELGHILMNHDLNYYKITFTIDNPPNTDSHKKTEKIFENEANIFAGELLVPLDMLKKEFKKNSDIPTLASIFEVSTQTLSIKVKDHMSILYK